VPFYKTFANGPCRTTVDCSYVFAKHHWGIAFNVTDPTGLGVKSTVELVSQGNEYRHTFTTDNQGALDAKRLPYGIYQVQIRAQGFAEVSESVEIRSALPLDRTIRLKLASVSESVKVTASDTLMDPYRPGSVNELGSERFRID
jgi:hypothetical protein